MSRSLFVIISTVMISTFWGFTFWALGSAPDNDRKIYLEHGLIENLQICILLASCIIYFMAAIFSKRTEKLIFCFFSLLCYTFILREITIWKLDVPHALKIIGSGIGRDLSIGMAFAAIFAYAILSNCSHYIKTVKGFIRTRPGVLLVAASISLFIGAYMEDQKHIIHREFFEEICELFSYLLILLSSLAIIPFLNNTTVRFKYREKRIDGSL